MDVLNPDTYSPDKNDILHTSVKVKDEDFKFSEYNNVTFNMFCLSTLSFRKNLDLLYGETSAVVFVVSLNDYDLITEDDDFNRLLRSGEMFKKYVNTEELKTKPIILLFNKYDLFLEKLKIHSFKSIFL
jgi:GTPase SAR1 family protein